MELINRILARIRKFLLGSILADVEARLLAAENRSALFEQKVKAAMKNAGHDVGKFF
jgi:hypothetical protein